MARLALPNLWIVPVGNAVILLDVRADRYSRLSGDRATAALRTAARQADLAGYSDPNRPTVQPMPPAAAPILAASSLATRSALEEDGPLARVRAGSAGAALVGARLSLRTRGLHATLMSALRLTVRQGTSAPEQSAACARGFARARLAIPAPRRCLPDALALFTVLRRRDLAATLVIGVRDAPFAAHAWVEARDLVLSDPLASVGEYQPILRL